MIAIGTRTGVNTLSGSCNNIFIGNSIAGGYSYLQGNCGFSGQRNTILGHCAGFKIACGTAMAVSNDNVFLGFRSGTGNRGCRNTFIGTYSNHLPTASYGNVTPTSFNNTIAIGFSAQPLASNTLVLGSPVAPLSTVATAGAAAGFLIVNINGTHRKIAFNNF
jgi:hypothetical protein